MTVALSTLISALWGWWVGVGREVGGGSWVGVSGRWVMGGREVGGGPWVGRLNRGLWLWCKALGYIVGVLMRGKWVG